MSSQNLFTGRFRLLSPPMPPHRASNPKNNCIDEWQHVNMMWWYPANDDDSETMTSHSDNKHHPQFTTTRWIRICSRNVQKSVDIKMFPEDVVSVTRSCLDSSTLLIDFHPLRNGHRVHLHIQMEITNEEGRLDHFEESLQEWINPPPPHWMPPHHPLPAHCRRILVLLNPFSGQQKALEIWRRDVEPLWRMAGIQIEMKITERPGHATELTKQMDLDRLGMLALGGGDGLVSEALHGLLSRPNADRALRLPILHLPMGTGNALASSICFQANEPFSPRGTFCQQMALMALRPVYRQLRLHRVQFGNGQHRTMFLSLSWGLMADIDIGSERFRFLGMARLHLEAFIRVARLPSVARYRAKISYLPAIPEHSSNNVELEKLMARLRFGVNEARENFGPNHFVDGLLEEDGNRGDVELPPLSEPVPSNWNTIEGEFCFVTVAALSHLGSDLPYLPSARLHDPHLFLTFVQWPKLHSRLHMARILLSIDTSAHLADPTFEIIPCLACRIEPEAGAGGMLALDGEAVEQSSSDKRSFQVASTGQCATVVSRLERRSTIEDDQNWGDSSDSKD